MPPCAARSRPRGAAPQRRDSTDAYASRAEAALYRGAKRRCAEGEASRGTGGQPVVLIQVWLEGLEDRT
eukprot:343383-Alexandrium_andersonii.AAC.1